LGLVFRHVQPLEMWCGPRHRRLVRDAAAYVGDALPHEVRLELALSDGDAVADTLPLELAPSLAVGDGDARTLTDERDAVRKRLSTNEGSIMTLPEPTESMITSVPT
jgi:hypothetical protein